MSNSDTGIAKRPVGAERPFPWQCRSCGERGVEIATIDYDAEARHDGTLNSFAVRDLKIPICQRCGAKVFTESVDDQINAAMRKHLQLLTPDEIRASIEKLDLPLPEIALRLRITESTLSYWMNGTQIQSGAMDTLLRIFFTFSQVRDSLPA